MIMNPPQDYMLDIFELCFRALHEALARLLTDEEIATLAYAAGINLRNKESQNG